MLMLATIAQLHHLIAAVEVLSDNAVENRERDGERTLAAIVWHISERATITCGRTGSLDRTGQCPTILLCLAGGFGIHNLHLRCLSASMRRTIIVHDHSTYVNCCVQGVAGCDRRDRLRE